MVRYHWQARGLVLTILMLLCSLPAVAQQSDWHDIASALMSPACPGRTLINCTSAQSEQWRELIRQKLAQGQSSAEIIQYFVDISGEEILAAPPKRGFALTAWLLPAFVLLNGAGLIMVLTLRWARRTPARSSAAYDLAAQGEAAPSEPYLRRVQQDLERLQR